MSAVLMGCLSLTSITVLLIGTALVDRINNDSKPNSSEESDDFS